MDGKNIIIKSKSERKTLHDILGHVGIWLWDGQTVVFMQVNLYSDVYVNVSVTIQ